MHRTPRTGSTNYSSELRSYHPARAVTPSTGRSRRLPPCLGDPDHHAMSPAPKSGIFIIAPIEGHAGERIAELQRTHDPRILKLGKPHVTIVGSSGAGPI